MSTAGVFQLISNDGKSDRMILATKLLNERIKEIMCMRRKMGKSDIMPTLVDIERTHILYVNAHFKPYAAIGFEYNKVRPSAGSPTLGSSITFSIPQFGDFFHDMVVRTRLGPVMGVAGLTPLQGTALFPYNDAEADTYYNIVDAFGNILVAGVASGADTQVSYRNMVRYCEYPGNRLFQNVKFDVNGNPLDQYDYMVPVMLEKFCVSPNKRIGHDRLLGQEVPLSGYSGLCAGLVSDADAANTPAGIKRSDPLQSNQTVALFTSADLAGGLDDTILGQTSLTALNATPLAQFDVSRKLQQIVNGPQTPKPVQPALELWNKLRFWFNEDVRLSVPSVSIPFGQRFINIDLAQQSLLTYEVPSIYLETIVDGAATVAPHPTAQRVKTYTPIVQQFGVTDVTVEKIEMYINNIFVNPEIHDIYIKRIGFSLIRIYRQQTQRVNNDSTAEVLLSQLKWPIEYIFVGVRPTWNIKDAKVSGTTVTGNQNQWRDWHRLTRQVDVACDEPCLAETPSGALRAATGSSIGQVQPDQYWLPVPTVNSLSLTSHGIVLYDNFTDQFFNQYLPTHYGGQNLNTPEDHGALFVNMSLYPRSYQPSGHLNISRARETYIKWTTSYVSATSPADLLAIAVAINFLLITDGSAVLRYST